MSHDPAPQIPADAPKAGDVYKHYKGNNYKVVGLALHSDETWSVVYEPMYESEFKMFTRPLREWGEEIEWEGSTVPRFKPVV